MTTTASSTRPSIAARPCFFPPSRSCGTATRSITYGRSSTPTVKALEQAIAEVEGGAATALTASGYQAVSTAILAFVESGDHILMVDSVYQPTRKFCDYMLSKLGVETTYYDPLVGAGIDDARAPQHPAHLHREPRLADVRGAGHPCHRRASPPKRELWLLHGQHLGERRSTSSPFAHGVDVSIQAATKYIVGHADAMLGAITSNARAAKHVAAAKELLGVCPGSEETYLGMRGLRTLSTRLAQHQRAGLEIARWLEGRPEVARVLHPGLPSHPQHAIWKRDFLGASGLFSVVLKPASKHAVAAMLDGLKLFGMGFSWGGYESLVIPFDAKAYRTATKWEAEGPALRFHIGLEDVDDLRADLEAGFDRLNATK